MRPLLAVALAALALAAGAAPLPPVAARGEEFVIGDTAFRFVGVNLRGAAHYGGGDVLPYTTAQHRIENLDSIAAMGGTVIRVFAPIPQITVAQNIARLGTLLDQCEARGLRVIVALTDFYHASGFRVPGDDPYYTGGYLNSAFFSGGYQTNYLPWVRQVVAAHAGHSAVFAWEIGNELTAYTGGVPADIFPFVAGVAAEIRALDPGTMIAFGGINVQHLGVVPRTGGQTLAMFADPNIDFVTLHIYNDEYTGDADDTFRVAYAVEKPIIIEETGLNPSLFANRPATLAAEMAGWLDARGARGILQWGFQSQTFDIGDGDGLFGMDPNFFAFDWAAMRSTYQTRAALFAANPPVVPEIGLPEGTNVAPGSVAWASSSSFSPAYGPDRAIDGVISDASKWTSSGASATSWMALDLGQVWRLHGAIVRSAGSAFELVAYNTTDLQVQTGDSLAGPWTTRFTFSDPRSRNRAVCRFASPVDARFVRLLITDAGIDNHARIPEFEVYATPATTAVHSGFLYR